MPLHVSQSLERDARGCRGVAGCCGLRPDAGDAGDASGDAVDAGGGDIETGRRHAYHVHAVSPRAPSIIKSKSAQNRGVEGQKKRGIPIRRENGQSSPGLQRNARFQNQGKNWIRIKRGKTGHKHKNVSIGPDTLSIKERIIEDKVAH